MIKNLILVFLSFLLMTGCKKDKQMTMSDSPTSGEITIAVDESLLPLIDAEINAFEGVYQNAKINANYVSEEVAVENLIKNKARLAIVCRELTPAENTMLNSQMIYSRSIKVAFDGVAIIASKDCGDSTISLEKLKDILSDNQRTKEPTRKKPIVVFDQTTSSTVRFVRDKILPGQKLGKKAFALKSNPSVLEYIRLNQLAYGIIGVSWISDKNDILANNFLNQVKVLGVSSLEKEEEYYKPYQAYIATRKYPLIREVFIISREARAGLGSGFMSFVASDKGQRVVLKSGLVPATMPVRIVEFNNESLFE